MIQIQWDICPHLHTMSDFGFASKAVAQETGSKYGRSHTNNAECYAERDRIPCPKNGRCLIAKTPDWKQVNKNTWQKKGIKNARTR